MAAQHKSEGSLGPERKEGEGEHGVRMKSPTSPNLWTVFLRVTSQMTYYWGKDRKCIAALLNACMRRTRVRAGGVKPYGLTRGRCGHTAGALISMNTLHQCGSRERRKKKGLFRWFIFRLLPSPPLLFPSPSMSLYDSPRLVRLYSRPSFSLFCLIIDFPVNLLKVQVVG